MFDPDSPLPGEVVEVIERLRAARNQVIESASLPDATFAEVVAAARGHHDSASVYVLRVLEAIPSVGKVRARRALDEIGRDYFVRIADLSDDDVMSLNRFSGLQS